MSILSSNTLVSANSVTDVFALPNNIVDSKCGINILNLGTTDVALKVWVSNTVPTSDLGLIASETLRPGIPFIRNCMHLEPDERIYVEASDSISTRVEAIVQA